MNLQEIFDKHGSQIKAFDAFLDNEMRGEEEDYFSEYASQHLMMARASIRLEKAEIKLMDILTNPVMKIFKTVHVHKEMRLT